MDRHELNKKAEEYATGNERLVEVSERKFYWLSLKLAFIDGADYAKQESEGLREEVLKEEQDRLWLQLSEIDQLIANSGDLEEIRLKGKREGICLALENIRQSLTPPHLNKANDPTV